MTPQLQWFRHPRVREPLLALLLVVVFARALLPAGFMPASDGGFPLQLCSAGLPAPLNTGGTTPAAPASSGIDTLCGFAATPMLAGLPNAVGLFVALLVICLLSLQGHPAATAGIGPKRAQSARAPPAHT
jgi:hypothetical protein